MGVPKLLCTASVTSFLAVPINGANCGLLNSQSHWTVGTFTINPQPAKQKEDDGGIPSPLR